MPLLLFTVLPFAAAICLNLKFKLKPKLKSKKKATAILIPVPMNFGYGNQAFPGVDFPGAGGGYGGGGYGGDWASEWVQEATEGDSIDSHPPSPSHVISHLAIADDILSREAHASESSDRGRRLHQQELLTSNSKGLV